MSRSGTPTTPNAKRTRPMVTLTLSHEALARLDAIAAERGQTRSGAVEQLVRNARLRTCHRWEYVQGMRDDPCECERCNPTEGLGDEEDEK